jgi:hypothetical protein
LSYSVSLGHSARAGQTLAKKAIKIKKPPGRKILHGFHSVEVKKRGKNTGLLRACQAFSKSIVFPLWRVKRYP